MTSKEKLEEYLGVKLVGDTLSAQNVLRIMDAIKWRVSEEVSPDEERMFYKKALPTTVGASSCLHDNCQLCHGTGTRIDGLGSCKHALACPCPKHSVLITI